MPKQELQKTTQCKKKSQLRKPRKFNVVLNNDDHTPMDFVVDILKHVFRHEGVDAISLMLEVHHQGKGVAGCYSKEIAEQKLAETMNWARNDGHLTFTAFIQIVR